MEIGEEGPAIDLPLPLGNPGELPAEPPTEPASEPEPAQVPVPA